MKNKKYILPSVFLALTLFALAGGISANKSSYSPNNMYPVIFFGLLTVFALLRAIALIRSEKNNLKQTRIVNTIKEPTQDNRETKPDSDCSNSDLYYESEKPRQAIYTFEDLMSDMDGHSFEYFCADILENNGYTNIQVTPGSGDQGVDVLAEKDGVKYAIQCKNYSTQLGNTPIQEVTAGKTYYHCHVGVVMTNSSFTKSAQELARATGTLLWDGAHVREMIETNPSLSEKYYYSTESYDYDAYEYSNPSLDGTPTVITQFENALNDSFNDYYEIGELMANALTEISQRMMNLPNGSFLLPMKFQEYKETFEEYHSALNKYMNSLDQICSDFEPKYDKTTMKRYMRSCFSDLDTYFSSLNDLRAAIHTHRKIISRQSVVAGLSMFKWMKIKREMLPVYAILERDVKKAVQEYAFLRKRFQ